MKWNSFDTRWMLSLFGTAVGAGILYLPIKAGVGGFWPVVAMTILTFPMVWLSHRALSRFCIEQNRVDNDITHAVEEYWGRKASFLITILYFFAIYPICLLWLPERLYCLLQRLCREWSLVKESCRRSPPCLRCARWRIRVKVFSLGGGFP